MSRLPFLLCCAALLVLAGCAGYNPAASTDGQEDGAPPVWDTRVLREAAAHERPVTEPEKKALASQGTIHFELEKNEAEEVTGLLQYFSMEKRPVMEKWLGRAAPHLRLVQAVLASYNLPPDLVVVPFVESGYSPMAYSPVGAGGMWQFMPETARRFGLAVNWWVDERRDPLKSTVAAAKYLTKLYQLFGDWNLALAAYNAGEGKVSRALAASGQCNFFDLAKDPKLLREETRRYVPRFLAMLKIYQNLGTLGFGQGGWPPAPDLATLRVPGGTDLLALARACGLSWEQFQSLNPAFRRQVSPPDAASTVSLPPSLVPQARAALAAPEGLPRDGGQNILAQEGENWEALARRSGMPLTALRQLNAALPETLAAGQAVRVARCATRQDKTLLPGEHPQCTPALAASSPPAAQGKTGPSVAAIAGSYDAGHASWPQTAFAQAGPLPGMAPAASSQLVRLPSMRTDVPAPQMAPSPTPPRAAAGTYTVQRGDTLYSICQRLGLDARALVAANKQALTRLRPGDVLTLPRAAIPGQAEPTAAANLPRLPRPLSGLPLAGALAATSVRPNPDSAVAAPFQSE